MSNRTHILRITTFAAPLALAAALLTGCTSPTTDTTAEGSDATQPASSPPSSTPSETSSAEADSCFLELFDGDDFDETDDHFVLTEPGRYEDLSSLPGAEQDWTDEADSLWVGPAAIVTIWADTGFGGESQVLDPGSELPDADGPSSLELACES